MIEPKEGTQADEKEDREEEALLREARNRYDEGTIFYADIRRNALEDLQFRAGDQWPEQLKQQREAEMRPCLTNNRLPQFTRQVTNEFRQNKMALRVSPAGDGASQDTAEVVQGLFRTIEYNSNADTAYVTAIESAVNTGVGYMRVVTEYESPQSFNMVLRVKRVRNIFTVTLDPNAQELDGSDAKWCFIEELMPKAEFEAEYPDAKICNTTMWSSGLPEAWMASWYTGDQVKVVEYFRKVMKVKTLCLLADGKAVFKEIADKLGVEVVKTRKTKVPVIEWYSLNGYEVLEKTEFPGEYIPVVPVYGSELDLNGEIIYEGLIRNAKDSQRMYNFWLSAETETIMAAPKAPILGAEGQFDGDKKKWDSVTKRNFGYITYTPQTLNGTLLPPPYRLNNEANIQAITQARMGAVEDMKAATGIYTAALGAPSAEQTGRAINARVGQSQLNNAHYNDNLSVAYRHLGRILLSATPFVYDTARVLRIINDVGETTEVQVNQKYKENEVEKLFDLTVGRYDIIIDSGPAFATRRRETVDAMMQWNQSFPQLSEMGGDIIAAAMDWPGARELASRLKKMLPPGVNGDNINPQQLMQENEQLKAQLAELQEVQMKLASSEKIAMMDNHTRLEVAQIKAETDLQTRSGEQNGNG